MALRIDHRFSEQRLMQLLQQDSTEDLGEDLEGFSLSSPRTIDPDLSNFTEMTQDVKDARQRLLLDIPIPEKVDDLFQVLECAKDNLPREYQETIGIPLLNHLQHKLNCIQRNGQHQLQIYSRELDVIRAILLHGNICKRILNVDPKVFCKATKAAQELTSSLYNEFVIAQGEHFPIEKTTPSLHTWKVTEGPYTYILNDLKILGLKTTIVVMPIVHVLGGLLAWTAYAHEVAGHNQVHASICLEKGLERAVFNELYWNAFIKKPLAIYWSNRVDETVADVLGVLSLGPAASIGLVGYLRAISHNGRLRVLGRGEDPHPSDLVRGLLVARVIQKLNFSNAHEWAAAIEKEVVKDYPRQVAINAQGKTMRTFASVQLGDLKYSFPEVIKSVDTVANAILCTRFSCLGNRTLLELRSWNDKDMDETSALMYYINGSMPLDKSRYKATHVVAAAVFTSLEKDAKSSDIFNRMIELLSKMNDFNSY